MSERSTPGGLTISLLTALALLGGIVGSHLLPIRQLGWALALVGAGCPARGRLAGIVVGLGLGLTCGWSRPPEVLPSTIDPARPLTLVAHRVGEMRRDGARVYGRAAVELMRQGTRVERGSLEVRVSLPLSPGEVGSRWRALGYLRRSPRLANGAGSRPEPWRLYVKSRRHVTVLDDERWSAAWSESFDRWRESVRGAIAANGGGGRGAALARALVLGDREALPDNVVRALRRVGLAHFVALSGLHLGVLAAWAGVLVGARSRGLRWTVVALVTLAYVVLGGASPGLVRAWAMVLSAAAALLCRRPPRSLHALAWVAAGLAVIEPSAVLAVGTQLTFLATAGVVLGARWLGPAWPWLPRWLATALATTLGAQLATLPIVLFAFRWMPRWAWCWNVLWGPVVAVAVPGAFLWTATAWVCGPLARAFVWVLDALAALVWIPAGLPANTGGGGPAALGWGWVVGATVLSILLLKPRLLAAASTLAGCWLLVASPSAESRSVSLHFLDVGQGDALVMRSGAGALLVDGGGWRREGVSRKALLPALARLRVDRLEAVILSHGDRDHCQGVLELAGYVPIEEIWMAPGTAMESCGRSLSLLPGVRVRGLWAGQVLGWRDWSFEVLSPLPGARHSGNDGSLVLRASALGQQVLLTGDIGRRMESRILARVGRDGVRASILKVAHHGSASSSGRPFLEATRPELAVVSAGVGNSFGHPAGEVLERLWRLGIPVLRIDRLGAIDVSWSSPRGRSIRTPGAPR